MICNLCKRTDVELIWPLHLWGPNLAVYQQLNKEEKESLLHIKQALIAAYSPDSFNTWSDGSVATWFRGKSNWISSRLTAAWLACGRSADDMHVHFGTATAHKMAAMGVIKDQYQVSETTSGPGTGQHDWHWGTWRDCGCRSTSMCTDWVTRMWDYQS